MPSPLRGARVTYSFLLFSCARSTQGLFAIVIHARLYSRRGTINALSPVAFPRTQ